MKKIIFFICVFTSASFFAQQTKQLELTGVLSFDSKILADSLFPSEMDEGIHSMQNKSVLVAGGLSFLVPGAGQFYNGDYWKTAVFAVLEIAAITTAIIYDGKGDDQTNVYKDFANSHWSAAQYANWTYQKFVINGDLNESDFANLFTNSERTNVNWNVLNNLEEAIGGYYSHKLAPFGDQQYYEMIGKYPQFNPGWDDFGDVNTPFQYGDPLTSKFKFYSGERGKANDFYNTARTGVIVLVTNHILSTLEAAWSANRYNKSLTMDVSLEKQQIGFLKEIYPKLNLQYNFNL
jgi:hypothetical protein